MAKTPRRSCSHVKRKTSISIGGGELEVEVNSQASDIEKWELISVDEEYQNPTLITDDRAPSSVKYIHNSQSAALATAATVPNVLV